MTEKQIEVLQLVDAGFKHHEIGASWGVSRTSVCRTVGRAKAARRTLIKQALQVLGPRELARIVRAG